MSVKPCVDHGASYGGNTKCSKQGKSEEGKLIQKQPHGCNRRDCRTHLFSLIGGTEYTVPIIALASKVNRKELLVKGVGIHPKPSPPRRLSATATDAALVERRPAAMGKYGLLMLRYSQAGNNGQAIGHCADIELASLSPVDSNIRNLV